MIALKIVYLANIIVAGWISITCTFAPKVGLRTVFENSIAYSEAIRLVGALWGAIFLLSIAGLWFPYKMAVVLLFQLIYKTTWLCVVAAPAVLKSENFPKGMAVVFMVWVLCCPLLFLGGLFFQ